MLILPYPASLFARFSWPADLILDAHLLLHKMSKRAAPADATSPAGKATKTGAARPSAVESSEMGEFEDAFEDELEDDDEVVDGGEDGACVPLP